MISTLPKRPTTISRRAPIFKTKLGRLYLGRSEEVLASPEVIAMAGCAQLIFTSPPFPLNKKKRYGNLQGTAYVDWLASYGAAFSRLLAPNGSVVMEIGNAWEAGRPIQSLLPYQALLAFVEAGGFNLCQEITYYNPARLPSPAQWVTVERIRLKDATTKIWWMAKCDRPKADNRRVLRPYGEHMKKLLRRGSYNSGLRPSEHKISEVGFLKDNGGAIAPNLIELPNTSSSHQYQSFCKELGIQSHPARMPEGIPQFFIKFLTEPGDLVVDPFSGSNSTGDAAEGLKRRWISIEADPSYACGSVSRFSPIRARGLLKRFGIQ